MKLSHWMMAILLPIALMVGIASGGSASYHKTRCLEAALDKISGKALIALIAVNYRAENLFSGPTSCQITLGYQIPGQGASWIWVDKKGPANHISGIYSKYQAADQEQMAAAQTWANRVTDNGNLFTITVP